jgi:hypothetical protein
MKAKERKGRGASPNIIELGSAVTATRGPWGHFADDVLKQDMPGLVRD